MSPLAEYPSELTLTQKRGRWVLAISGPYFTGTASSTEKATVLAVAMSYATWRRGVAGALE